MKLPNLLLPFLALATAACSSGESAAPAPDTSALERFVSAEEPAGAEPVAAVRASAADGDHVTVVGVVGGAEQVFVDGAATFTLVDPSLASCVDDGTDCETPWDYCCVDPATLRERIATVELRDGARLLPASPRGLDGLDHLSTVVVEGTAERDARGNLVVAAERVHVRS